LLIISYGSALRLPSITPVQILKSDKSKTYCNH
jgi:hypothetical protein